MTIQRLRCIRCDNPDCTARLVAFEGESVAALRVRARDENGWRFTWRVTVPHDWCRLHA